MKTKRTFLIFWLIFTVLITSISLSTSLAPPVKFNIDKFGHFGANFIIAFVPALFYKKISALYFIIVGTISLGVLVEVMQTNIIGREGSIGDVVANSLGVLSAVFIAYRINKIRESSKKSNDEDSEDNKDSNSV